ncbi:MAG: trypsin-like serine protease, partial [Pseudomonadota bacterium]
DGFAGPFRRTLGLAFVALCALAPPASAELLSDENHKDFIAIGRLNLADWNWRRTCTATLIGPETVLTAAHCLDPVITGFRDADQLKFVAGWLKGDYAALGTGYGIAPDEGYQIGEAPIGTDIAAVTLSETLEVAPIPLTTLPNTTSEVTKVGYDHRRPHALEKHTCPILAREGRALLLACASHPGNSGAPLLVSDGNQWKIVGVVSASIPSKNQTIGVLAD